MGRIVIRVLASVLMLLLGMYIIVNPAEVLAGMVVLFAAYIILDGVRNILASRVDEISEKMKKIILTKGFATILVGLIILIIGISHYNELPTFLVYVTAAVLLVSGIIDAYDLLVMYRLGGMVPGLGMQVIATLVSSILLFMFPSAVFRAVSAVIGALIFALGAVGAYSVFVDLYIVKKIRKECGE